MSKLADHLRELQDMARDNPETREHFDSLLSEARAECERVRDSAPEHPGEYAEVGVSWHGQFNFTIDGSWTAEQARDELLPWIQYWVAQATSRETTGSG